MRHAQITPRTPAPPDQVQRQGDAPSRPPSRSFFREPWRLIALLFVIGPHSFSPYSGGPSIQQHSRSHPRCSSGVIRTFPVPSRTNSAARHAPPRRAAASPVGLQVAELRNATSAQQ